MASTASVKRTVPSVQKRIDNHTQSFPPLDYSFHNAEQLEDAVAEPRVPTSGPKLTKQGDRYQSHGIILNHNALNGSLETLPDFIRTTLVDPNALSTLDLSFNVFTEIPIVVTQFPALKCFYFHKNMLSDMTEVQKLVSLKQLKYLTLHGNPIEITVPYLRSYVLCLLPGLRSLNCTPVTKGDRKISEFEGNEFTGILIGPEQSDYAGGYFHFLARFPPEYPFKPPEFFFITRTCHPNVDSSTGVICHDELVAEWRSTMTLTDVLTEMHFLMANPNYDVPIEGDTLIEKTPENAREWTQLYAQAAQTT